MIRLSALRSYEQRRTRAAPEPVRLQGEAMTKGEARKARKAAREAGQDYTVERRPDGGLEIVQTRTVSQERRHERAMERWARRIDSDPDWR